jgi:phosphoenolpyruvate carboxylase
MTNRSDDDDRKIPNTMSTQHPDNAAVPEWSDGAVIDGETEISEAFFVYHTLGCHEVMWDAEGKDVDTRVERKLLTKYEDFFRKHVLGRDVFLTYRIPNPRIENVERKIVVETLQNIPIAYDVASSFYKKSTTPIFEVILPFTTDAREPLWLYKFYQKAIASKGEIQLDASTTVRDWVGLFKPEKIQVIPLVEDLDSLLTIDKLVDPYISAVRPKYLRVFIARSDPALNYGLVCAVILSKLALSKLKALEDRIQTPIYPIIGAGSLPFRGHLSPRNIDSFLNELRGLSTVTAQSAFRYDYPIEEVKQAIASLNERLPNGDPIHIEPDEETILLRILDKFRAEYENVVEALAPLVNSVATHVPSRRARRLHIGLFGYSRRLRGISLPRAITFAAAFYSLGVPPEVIGGKALADLDNEEWDVLRGRYTALTTDIRAVAGFLSWPNLNMLMEMREQVAERAGMSVEALKNAITQVLDGLDAIEDQLGLKLGSQSPTERKHENFVNNFLISFVEGEEEEARRFLIEAAQLRRCLG